MKQILEFLNQLKYNNNREWFNYNKDKYIQIRATAEKLCLELIQIISEFDNRVTWFKPSDCMYRIYRDTRFSQDKSPYKTHIGIFINPPYGKKGSTCGYYLHIEPQNCFFCAGTIGLPTKTINAIRQSIIDEIDEYRAIVESEEFKRYFTQLGHDWLKTVPKGFDKNWEYIDYIRPRNFTALMPIDDETMCKPNLPQILTDPIRQAKLFNDFINFTIEES